MPTKEEIQKRIEHSQAKFRKIKEEQEAKKKMLKEGRKFFHDNNLRLHVLFEGTVWFSYMKNQNEVIYAFSMLSKNDKPNDKVAKGLIGSRLMDKESDYRYRMTISEDISEEVIHKEVVLSIVADLLRIREILALPSHVEKVITNHFMYLC